MQLLEIAMHDFHTAGRAVNRRRRKPSFAFFHLGENHTKSGGPATSDEREDEERQDNYDMNSLPATADMDMKCNLS